MDFNNNENLNNYIEGNPNTGNKQDTGYKMNRKSKGIKLWVVLLIILIIMIISTATFAFVYISTDLFKSDKTLFMKYAGLNTEEIQKLFEPFSVEQISAEKYRQKITVDVDFAQGVGTSEENTDNGINDLKLELTSEVDKTNNYEYDEIELVGINDESIQLQYIKNDQGQYISGTELFEDKFISFEEVLELIGVGEIPVNTDMGLTEEQISELLTKYAEIVNENLTDDSFSKLQNQTININGQDTNVNSYTLTITEAQLKIIVTEVLENVKSDEIILGMYESDEQKQEFIQNIENILNEWDNIEIESDSENNMSYTIYEKNGTVVGANIEIGEVKIKLEWEQSENKKLNISVSSEENEIYSFFVENKDNTVSLELPITETQKVILKYSASKEDNKILQSFVIEYMNDIKDIKLKIDGEFEPLETVEIKKVTEEDVVNINESYFTEFTTKITEILSNNLSEKDQLELTSVFSEEQILFEDDGVLSETEKNRYNSEFELLVGENISSENLLASIDAIGYAISGREVVSNEVLRLIIDKENGNEEIYQSIKTFIEENTSNIYNIELEYNEDGIVSAILLTIVQEED